MSKLLTRQQAAERLGVSVATIDLERVAGRLAYIQRKPNGRVWISEGAIEEYLERGLHEAKPEIRIVDTYRKRRA